MPNAPEGAIALGNAAMSVAPAMPHAAPEGAGTAELQPLGVAGQAAHFTMDAIGSKRADAEAPTSVTLFDQGLVQVLEASVTGLEPRGSYVLALAQRADESGTQRQRDSVRRLQRPEGYRGQLDPNGNCVTLYLIRPVTAHKTYPSPVTDRE